MQRIVTIAAESKKSGLEVSIPQEIAPHFDQVLSLPEYFKYNFEIAEKDWDILPKIRQYIREQWRETSIESWRCRFSPEDKHAASLLRFTPRVDLGIIEHNDPIYTESTCRSCGRISFDLVERPRLRLSLLSKKLPCIFYAPISHVLVITHKFFNALVDEGLQGGLTTIPVDILRGPDEEFVALQATQTLEWPVTPFGLGRDHCSVCGNVIKADPLYAFYWVFERLQRDADWYYWPVHGPGSPLISQKVHSWIRKHADAYSHGSLPDNWFDGQVYGWYPDEKDAAFLPQKYQDPELSATAVL